MVLTCVRFLFLHRHTVYRCTLFVYKCVYTLHGTVWSYTDVRFLYYCYHMAEISAKSSSHSGTFIFNCSCGKLLLKWGSTVVHIVQVVQYCHNGGWITAPGHDNSELSLSSSPLTTPVTPFLNSLGPAGQRDCQTKPNQYCFATTPRHHRNL